jgi:hypothetical protein
MKTFLKILGILAVILVVAVVALNQYLDRAILKGFNALAPNALGVPASLEDVRLRILRGSLSLSGLHLGNPEGYKTPGLLDLASVKVQVDNASLSTDTLVVNEIAIDGLVLTYEKGLLNSNLGALIDLLGGDETADLPDEPKDETPAEEPADDKPAKKVVIEKLSITGARMNFSITGAAALTGGGSIPIPLPDIVLTDLGKEKDKSGGITVVEAIREILAAIAGAAGSAIAGSAQLIGDTFGAVGDGVWAVGKGTADVGANVVGGVLGAVGLGGKKDGEKAEPATAPEEALEQAAEEGKGMLDKLNPFGE